MFTTLGILGLVAIFITGVLIFVNTAPQFGKKPSGEDLIRISQSQNFKDNKFINLIPTSTGEILKAIGEMPKMMRSEGLVPNKDIEYSDNWLTEDKNDSLAKITWFGHSTFLIEIDDKNILIDPMFGEVAAPISFGTKRFAMNKKFNLELFEKIDVVIISHDHYDHLDYPSILALKEKTKTFITPLGVGSHLKHWGVNAENIIELDWWQETYINNIKLKAYPSRHFSGRALSDRDATQWASWGIFGEKQNIYFSGDGGYGPHFKEIGQDMQQIDFAMIECGQYNQLWSEIHMMPEESVQAAQDLGAKLSMPIHWGAFRLAPHHWQDPVLRFSKTAKEKNIDFVTPKIGDSFTLGLESPSETWWINY